MTDEAMSPLRRRMIKDMTIRKLAPKTQHDYVQRIKNFAAFLGRSPDTATFEDARRYQRHLAASGVGVPPLNGARLFEELESLRELNERQILEGARRALELKDQQKNLTLKAVDHRIKNSLLIVSSPSASAS